MEQLIKNTTAYKILSGDGAANRLSHAYMLHFQDIKNMRSVLKLFALEIFQTQKNSGLGQRILNESLVDLKIYPPEGKKLTVEMASEIIEDGAMRPVEGSKKLYIICGFETASALIQNKLLKTLEEPLEGMYFLLGVCSLSPVLDTVKSRVKLLEIAPFTEAQIFSALERQNHNELNAAAAKSANGNLGAAQSMVEGGWFEGVAKAAAEICATCDIKNIGEISIKYGDIKYKEELLSEMQRLYFLALTEEKGPAKRLCKPALVFALEKINGANADLKFNAYFQGLLYDFMLEVAEFHGRAVKLL